MGPVRIDRPPKKNLQAAEEDHARRTQGSGRYRPAVAAMADHFGTDLDQLVAQRRQRPVLEILGQCEFSLVAEAVEKVPKLKILEIMV